jgi:hypothetical protein
VLLELDHALPFPGGAGLRPRTVGFATIDGVMGAQQLAANGFVSVLPQEDIG